MTLKLIEIFRGGCAFNQINNLILAMQIFHIIFEAEKCISKFIFKLMMLRRDQMK